MAAVRCTARWVWQGRGHCDDRLGVVTSGLAAFNFQVGLCELSSWPFHSLFTFNFQVGLFTACPACPGPWQPSSCQWFDSELSCCRQAVGPRYAVFKPELCASGGSTGESLALAVFKAELPVRSPPRSWFRLYFRVPSNIMALVFRVRRSRRRDSE
jgi:hypothetical protein